MEAPDLQKDPIEIHGELGADLSLACTTYRCGTQIFGRVQGPKIGPLQTGLTVRIPTNGSSSLYPLAQVDTSLPIPLTEWLTLKPSLNLGEQAFLTGLNNPDTTEMSAHPFGRASLAMPLMSQSQDPRFYTTPSLSVLHYFGTDGISLKIDDKNLDGTPDYTRPSTELTAGLEAGVKKDGWTLNTKWTYDLLDPTVAEDVPSFFGTVGVAREF